MLTRVLACAQVYAALRAPRGDSRAARQQLRPGAPALRVLCCGCVLTQAFSPPVQLCSLGFFSQSGTDLANMSVGSMLYPSVGWTM